jgi:hypothetical protein
MLRGARARSALFFDNLHLLTRLSYLDRLLKITKVSRAEFSDYEGLHYTLKNL